MHIEDLSLVKKNLLLITIMKNEKKKKISSEGNLIKSMLVWKIAGKNSFSLPKNYSDIIE